MNEKKFLSITNRIDKKIKNQVVTAQLSDETKNSFFIKKRSKVNRLYDELEYAWIYFLSNLKNVYIDERWKQINIAKKQIKEIRKKKFKKDVKVNILDKFFGDYLENLDQIIIDSKKQTDLIFRLTQLNNKEKKKEIKAFLEKEEVEKIIRKAKNTKEARLKFINELEKFVDEDKLLVIITKTNKIRRYKVKTYTEGLMRTAVRDLQTKGVLDAAELVETDLVQVSSHNTICPICIEFEGKIYSISGKSKLFSPLQEAPPYHKYCLHSLTVVFEETLRRFGIKKYSDFSLGKSTIHPTIKNWIPISKRNIA